jgi:hypothetical protein
MKKVVESEVTGRVAYRSITPLKVRKYTRKRLVQKSLSTLAFCHPREGGNPASKQVFSRIFDVLCTVISLWIPASSGYDSRYLH